MSLNLLLTGNNNKTNLCLSSENSTIDIDQDANASANANANTDTDANNVQFEWLSVNYKPEWYEGLWDNNTNYDKTKLKEIKVFYRSDADTTSPKNVIVHTHGGSFYALGEYETITSEFLLQQLPTDESTLNTVIVVNSYPLIPEDLLASLAITGLQFNSGATIDFDKLVTQTDLLHRTIFQSGLVSMKVLDDINNNKITQIPSIKSKNLIVTSAGSIGFLSLVGLYNLDDLDNIFAEQIVTNISGGNYYEGIKVSDLSNSYSYYKELSEIIPTLPKYDKIISNAGGCGLILELLDNEANDPSKYIFKHYVNDNTVPYDNGFASENGVAIPLYILGSKQIHDKLLHYKILLIILYMLIIKC
jgi:hypothetical protein